MTKWILLFLLLAAAAAVYWLLGGAPAAPPPPLPSPVAPRIARIEPGTLSPPGAGGQPAQDPHAPPVTPPKTVGAAGSLVVVGRVVDERRFPIAGARVALHRTGEPALTAVAGVDGGFRIEGIPRPGIGWYQPGLFARAPDGRVATGTASISSKSPAEVDAGVLVVGVAVPLAVRVVDGGVPVPGARVFAGWAFSLCFEAVAGPDGIARFDGLPKQVINLLATAGDPARAGRGDAALQGSLVQPVEVALSAARTVEVTVVEKGTEKPIPGATFRILLQRRSPGMVMGTDAGPLPPVAPTDADGRTRIEGTCSADWLSLDGTAAPGYFPSGFRSGTTVKPGETQVRIELVGGRSLRFPVVAGEAPVPPDGAVITLAPQPGSGGPDPVGGARMEGSELVVETATAGYYMAVATAPDGSRTGLWADDKGTPLKEVSFVPGRTVEILAKRADGTPAAGVFFGLRNQGNNPLGDPKSTGEDGRVVFDGQYGHLTDVYLIDDPAQPWGGRTVGSVDLRKVGGRLEVVIPAKRTFVAKVTVDGTPRLVPQMFLQGVARFEEDPEKGEIRFEMALDASVKNITLTLNAMPWLPAKSTVDPLPETGPIPMEFALRSGGALLVDVKLPKDALAARLGLQKWDEAKSAWIGAMIPGTNFMGLSPGPDGLVRAEPLLEGRYRVLESTTGVATEGIEVRTGGDPARLSLDISRQGYAKGKIVIPEGAKMADARVLVKGTGIEARSPTTGGFDDFAAIRTQPDGSFMMRVPGDRPVTIVPWHPTLVPAPEGGTVELTEPREDVVLRLVAGARAVFRLNPAPAVHQWAERKPRVLLYAGDPAGDPVSEHPATEDGAGLAIGGFQLGTWTLWIDPGEKYAPAVVRGAVLAESGTDLGTVALVEGSRVRVKVLVKEGTAVPRIAVFAVREDAPKYTRYMNSNGEETAVVTGLGPGRFRITAMQNMGSPGKMAINDVHELDGTNDLELTMDLR